MTEYITNVFIDMVQDTKKAWVDTWIKDPSMNTPLKDFIKAQTLFTKDVVKHTNTFANAMGAAIAKVTK